MADIPLIPVSEPARQGADAAGILSLIDALEADAGQDPHSLIVVRHGHEIASGWWAPYTRERPHLLYSLSKSFTSTAAAFAVAEGLLDLDARVIDYFPEFADDITDPRSRAMLVRHVASMSSGHTAETLERALEIDAAEPVRGFLLVPPDRDPGTVFAYNQPCTYTLAAIIQKQSGQSLISYLQPRLFDPLGLPAFGWQQHPAGRNVGFTGLHATADAIARLGLLYLNGGRWDGRQLIPKAWVAEATRSHIPTAAGLGDEPTNPDWSQGYGFQFWMSRHGFRGDGAFGQFCLVLPEHDTVVAYTGATDDLQGTLDLIWRHLLPALGDAPLADAAQADADERLRGRLAGLRVADIGGRGAAGAQAGAQPDAAAPGTPPSAAVPDAPAGVAAPDAPAGPAALAAQPKTDTAWDGAVLQAAPDSVTAEPAPSGVEIARLDGRWRIALTDSAGRIEALLGHGEWAVTEDGGAPVAVQGGWRPDGMLRFDVIFLETPHRLRVTCSLADRTFVAAWVTTPLAHLSMGLTELQSPPVG